MSRWLPAFAVHRPVTVIMGFVALCLLGGIALWKLPLDMWPSGFEAPYIYVNVPYRNTTPLENQERILRPVEEQLATLPGIKSMNSKAENGGANVSLEFHQSVEMAGAYNQVVDRMERAMAELPEEVDRYWIFRWNPQDEPKIWMGFTYPETTEDPYALVKNVVQRRLERIKGVGQVEIYGVYEKSAWIDFDREALLTHHVDLTGLLGRLATDNFQLAGGKLNDRGSVRYLRSLARFRDLDELKDFPVATGLRLSDIAEVSRRIEPNSNLSRINGKNAAAMGISKESGANTVAVCATSRAALEELRQDPRLEGFEFFVFFDQGKEIEKSIRNLEEAFIEGGIFAVIVLFLFLRDLRMTLLIAGCIPFSMLITVAVVYFRGGSLNLLSMTGLMIAVGMVVDNAIVVVETIYNARQKGLSLREAAIAGTSEVSLAITLSTLTTIVVFLPLILMNDDAMFSFLMKELGFPVIWALAASLLVALVFTPLSTVFIQKGAMKADSRWLVVLTRLYGRVLDWMLSHRADSVAWTFVLILLTFQFPMQAVSCNESDESTPSDFVIRYQVQGDFTAGDRLETVMALEKLAEENKERWGVQFYRTRLSSTNTNGSFYVTLLPDDERDSDAAIARREIIADVKKNLPDLPGVRMRVGWNDDGLENRSFTMELYGDDAESLNRLAEEVARRVETLPGVLSAYTSIETAGPLEVQLQVDRDAASRFGLSAQSVGQSLAFAMRGFPLGELWLEDHEVSLMSRFALADRTNLDTLMDFPLFSPKAGVVPLRSLATSELTRGWNRISRQDRRTNMGVRVDLEEGRDPKETAELVELAIKDMEWPRGYGWERGNRFKEEEESAGARMQALVLSTSFVFLLMGLLFESFLFPLVIIMTVPMALLGVWWTLFFTRTSLDIMAGVGLVILVGVVVNNGIVLIDTVNRLRAEGLPRARAIATAAQRRLRPILMTSLTTIVGVMPMAVGSSTFIDIPYAPLGRVVAGGLATATVLTLFFVPLVYTFLDDLKAAGLRLLAWIWPRGAENPPPSS